MPESVWRARAAEMLRTWAADVERAESDELVLGAIVHEGES